MKTILGKLNIQANNQVTRIFYLLLVTDISFFILHFIDLHLGLGTQGRFSIETDRGYAEIFQYLKEYWSALLLGFIALRTRSYSYLSWCLLFFYLLLDDSASIHERGGALLAQRLEVPSILGIATSDFGEIAVSFSAALLILVSIAIAYRFGDRSFRKFSKNLTVMLFALAMFGVVIDLIHNSVPIPALNPVLGFLEDGGEMLVMSGMACSVLAMSEQLLSSPNSTEDASSPLASQTAQ
ncbi:MAG: hypothetical protein KME43_22650 [Myxacorys chilensis ATA2-1-KO14]|nr:hypothetical protein [Myxacorys chilensis ATA2-1-KO14]